MSFNVYKFIFYVLLKTVGLELTVEVVRIQIIYLNLSVLNLLRVVGTLKRSQLTLGIRRGTCWSLVCHGGKKSYKINSGFKNICLDSANSAVHA